MTASKQSLLDDGQRRCPKDVEFYNRINIWIISASGRLFKKKSITMHGNMTINQSFTSGTLIADI